MHHEFIDQPHNWTRMSGEPKPLRLLGTTCCLTPPSRSRASRGSQSVNPASQAWQTASLRERLHMCVCAHVHKYVILESTRTHKWKSQVWEAIMILSALAWYILKLQVEILSAKTSKSSVPCFAILPTTFWCWINSHISWSGQYLTL